MAGIELGIPVDLFDYSMERLIRANLFAVMFSTVFGLLGLIPLLRKHGQSQGVVHFWWIGSWVVWSALWVLKDFGESAFSMDSRVVEFVVFLLSDVHTTTIILSALVVKFAHRYSWAMYVTFGFVAFAMIAIVDYVILSATNTDMHSILLHDFSMTASMLAPALLALAVFDKFGLESRVVPRIALCTAFVYAVLQPCAYRSIVPDSTLGVITNGTSQVSIVGLFFLAEMKVLWFALISYVLVGVFRIQANKRLWVGGFLLYIFGGWYLVWIISPEGAYKETLKPIFISLVGFITFMAAIISLIQTHGKNTKELARADEN